MCPVEPPEGNGKLIRYRLDRLEHRVKQDEEAFRLLAQMGARTNEQVLVHDEQFREQGRRLDDLEQDTKDLPAVRQELKDMKESYAAARTAGWAVVVALIGLAATIVLQGCGP